MWESVVPHINKRITCAIDARRSYPGVVDGCSHHAVQDFCFFFSVIHLQQYGDNWCKLCPELPISSSYLNLLHPAEREQTVGLENWSTTVSSAGLVFMSWNWSRCETISFEIVEGGGCYHTEEKRRMKRRRGCRGWRGSPILASRAQKITQKSLSGPQTLRGVTHWLVVGT